MSGKTIRKAGWVLIRNRRMLCVRSHGKGVFYVPGGKPEAGEDMESALRREILEELATTLAPDIRPLGTVSAAADGRDGVTVEMSLFAADPLDDPTPSGEIAELRWMNAADTSLVSAATVRILEQLKADNVID